MICTLFQTLQEDTSVLNDWIKGEDILPGDASEHLPQRVQLAAWRMLGLLGMAFASLWVLSLVAAIVSFPLMIGLNVATAVGIYVLGHDIFVMHQNVSQLSGQEAFEEELNEQLTEGTFLQPIWMQAYAKRP